MPIGQLYNPANVVVGQAACFIAPPNTPLPDISLTALVTGTPDPFDITPWTYSRLLASAPLTGTYTLSYTLNGITYGPTAAQTVTTGTSAALDAAITAILTGATSADVTVTGGPVSAVATPMLISLSDAWTGGTWTITPTVSGGTLSMSAALWTPLGATDQGWTWGGTKSTNDIYIEEQTTEIAKTVENQQISVQGALAEDISRSLALAYNMTTALTAATSGHAAYETQSLTDNVLSYAVALVMANSQGFPRWLYIPVATSLDTVTAAFRRANAKRMYTVTFTSICATSQIILENVVARGL